MLRHTVSLERVISQKSYCRAVGFHAHAFVHRFLVLIEVPDAQIVETALEVVFIRVGGCVDNHRRHSGIDISGSYLPVVRHISIGVQFAVHVKLDASCHAVGRHGHVVPVVIQVIALGFQRNLAVAAECQLAVFES